MTSQHPDPSANRNQSSVGRSAYDIVEGGCGGEFHRALILSELSSAAYGVVQEFEHDTEDPAVGLVRLCRLVQQHLDVLSITDAATLTLNRECARCSGDGKSKGEDPCIECGGSGFVHANEADG